MPRLRASTSAICSSIDLGREQVPRGDGVALADAVHAVLGLVVHRRAPLEVEEGDVGGARERDALPATRLEQTISRGPSGSWKAWTAASRSSALSAPTTCSASGSARPPSPGSRGGGRRPRAAPRTARKSSIQAITGPSLPRAASRAQRVELGEPLGAQGRLDLALELGQLERLLLQPGDDVALGQPVLLLVLQRHRDDDLALLGQLRQHVLLQAPHEAGAAQVPVDALLGAGALEAALEARAGAELLSRPRIRSCAISSSGWFITGVPVSADLQRVLGQLLGQPPHRPRALGRAGS